MSPESLEKKKKNPAVNNNLKSSIVHKPFATGTINIFNPHKSKNNGELNRSKLFLNAELEQETEIPATKTALELATKEIEYREKNWLDSLLSPWGVSAIAILFFANLISAAVIWRNSSVSVITDNPQTKLSTLGNRDLATQEFMPLNLSTLSKIKPREDIDTSGQESPEIVPISPALAPINNVSSLSSIDPQYHYVLTEYTGEKSLSLARQKVKQISLVNFPQGVFIYLGAFTDREQANQFVSRLEIDNLPARIYPFD